ncbi:hypothetical protein [Methanospirillum lacunae]|uniref:Uncharacterized protein n=1 Tax=Methanospirillum lacunae TaxID=668570 RepID=A0A2V2N7B2_9EURY|nr:hypothetical protein [Methanospirillum lacunae]PWR72117.1 hypothetical protein DK846_09005 [Methanospirillum lacunae]
MLISILFLFVLVGIVSVAADDPFSGTFTSGSSDTYDDSLYTSRSNVMESTVDPSFWDERKSLSIGKVEKRLVLPPSDPNNPTIQPVTSSKKQTGAELTQDEQNLITKAQEVALMLVNIPYYQAGENVFKLGDKQQVQLSSMKYAASKEYYGRTDISSSWVTDFYNAAYSDDYANVTSLLGELPAEVRTPKV